MSLDMFEIEFELCTYALNMAVRFFSPHCKPIEIIIVPNGLWPSRTENYQTYSEIAHYIRIHHLQQIPKLNPNTRYRIQDL